MILGNAYVDPYSTYGSYAGYAQFYKLIGEAEYLVQKEALKACQKLIENPKTWALALTECSAAVDAITKLKVNFN